MHKLKNYLAIRGAYPSALGGERNTANDLIATIRLRDHLHHREVISVKDHQVERTRVHLPQKIRNGTRQIRRSVQTG